MMVGGPYSVRFLDKKPTQCPRSLFCLVSSDFRSFFELMAQPMKTVNAKTHPDLATGGKTPVAGNRGARGPLCVEAGGHPAESFRIGVIL
jgi:hypothetical protein